MSGRQEITCLRSNILQCQSVFEGQRKGSVLLTEYTAGTPPETVISLIRKLLIAEKHAHRHF